MSTPTKARKTDRNPDLVEKILAQVKEDEIVAMSRDVINIPSPTGEELQMAQYMQNALQQLGLHVTWQEVEEQRANVVGAPSGASGSLSARRWRNKVTLVTHRCHILHMIGWRDCESSIVELADVPN